MRILIEPSGQLCQNIGDHAMLQTAYARLRSLWPQAEIRIFTRAPDIIRRTLPEALPVIPDQRWECFELKLFGRFSKPGFFAWRIFESLERSSLKHFPNFWAWAARLRLKLGGHHAAANLISLLQRTDLFVFSGAGIVTDPFAVEAIEGLESLHLAKQLRARTAILGHMFGPVTHDQLKATCRRVLPKVDLISVRERVTSLPFLAECGVPIQNVRLTGDETLEFVQKAKPASSRGAALGVNIRIAYYSLVTPAATELLGLTLGRLSKDLGAPLQPLVVTTHSTDNDRLALESLDSRFKETVEAPRDDSALGLARSVAECRLVITGSYHAAVFALAQGIPAVGLSFVPYYDAKFKGLQDLFGSACRYVDGTQPGWDKELENSVRELWKLAPLLQSGLLESTRRQVEASKAAYEELRRLVDGKIESVLGQNAERASFQRVSRARLINLRPPKALP